MIEKNPLAVHIHNSLAEVVGKTPIVRLSTFGAACRHNLLAKCEFLNPGGSVKDRIAVHMVDMAEQAGQLKPGGTIVEATAGNTGIGLAIVAAMRGYKLVVVVSDKVSSDKIDLLKALRAEVVVIPRGRPPGDPEHFVTKAQTIARERGGWFVDQFNNKTNVQIHYETTGPEIWEQTGGNVDVLVAGVGTGGTLTGCARFLRERKPELEIVLADPVGSTLADLIEGKTGCSGSYLVEGIGQDFVPGNFEMSLVDHAIRISDREAVAVANKLFVDEGMFVGSSAGCIAAAAIRYCENNDGPQKNVVLILPDGGRGYLSTIYNPSWLEQKLS